MQTRVSRFVLLIAILTSLSQARTFTVLYTFKGFPDGASPTSALIRDHAGNLYGTTQGGGGTSCVNGWVNGCGTVFKLDVAGHETVLHVFTGEPDGANPYPGLIDDPEGNLYGTTAFGGLHSAGTVFRIDPAGEETILYNFTGYADGSSPISALIGDSANNLYGTTAYGGGFNCSSSCGTVFKVTPAGEETILYEFSGEGGDGSLPYGSLVRDAGGILYGTTFYGGQGGNVFRLNPRGTETVLYNFKDLADGVNPWAGLLLDSSAGAFYGTTTDTVFKVTATGKETVLHTFTGGPDGGIPAYGPLLEDPAGNLYGTTFNGGHITQNCGDASCGVVFELSPTAGGGWTETVLHRFTGGADGFAPYAGLIRDDEGNLYGTASTGPGVYGVGVVFKITP